MLINLRIKFNYCFNKKLRLFHNLVIMKYFATILFALIYVNSSGQSIFLVKPNTNVYDSYAEDKIVKLTIKEETWVNYKGRAGEFFKVSNFFGKDKYYPIGIFEGYITINAVIDTANRAEYESLITSTNDNNYVVKTSEKTQESNALAARTDLDQYYLGMTKSDALSVRKPTYVVGNNTYKVNLEYNQNNMLSKIELSGKPEDALAVSEGIKSQADQLKSWTIEKYGKPGNSNSYPSFLEIDEGQLYETAIWNLPGKRISVGITEQNDLYFSSLVIQSQ